MQEAHPRRSTAYFYWLGGILLALSFLARAVSYQVVTSDYSSFLSQWFTTLQTHPGLTAFQTSFSDYAPLYLYFLKLLTFIPVSSLYSIKTLSVLFDIVIAGAAYFILKRTSPTPYTRSQLFFAFALMCSIPTVILNGALWGQSDSVYAAGIILSLYFILVDQPLPAVLAFSYAFCVKLQAIFFLPVLVGYCLRKESTAGYLLLIPLLFFASIIPARLAGGSLSSLLLIYVHESNEYPWLSVSAQSVFALLGNHPLSSTEQSVLFYAGLAVAGLCALLIAILVYRMKNLSARGMVFLSLSCVLLLPYFLPRMHERYFYLADLLSVIYVFYNPRLWYVPVLIVGTSFISYMGFLSQVSWFSSIHISLIYPSLILLFIAIPILLIEFQRVVLTAERGVS